MKCKYCSNKGYSYRAYEGKDRKVYCPHCPKGKSLGHGLKKHKD